MQSISLRARGTRTLRVCYRISDSYGTRIGVLIKQGVNHDGDGYWVAVEDGGATLHWRHDLDTRREYTVTVSGSSIRCTCPARSPRCQHCAATLKLMEMGVIGGRVPAAGREAEKNF